MFTVLKPFPHVNRRFVVGDPITLADIPGSAIPFDELKSRRFIAPSDTKLAEAAEEKAAAVEPQPESTEVVIPERSTALQAAAIVLEHEVAAKPKRSS